MNKREQIKAIEKIYKTIENGWCRNASYKEIHGEDHYCLTGAADKVVPNCFDSSEVIKLLFAHLPENLKNQTIYPRFALQRFNDSRKDKRQVLQFLNRALDKLSKKR